MSKIICNKPMYSISLIIIGYIYELQNSIKMKTKKCLWAHTHNNG